MSGYKWTVGTCDLSKEIYTSLGTSGVNALAKLNMGPGTPAKVRHAALPLVRHAGTLAQFDLGFIYFQNSLIEQNKVIYSSSRK